MNVLVTVSDREIQIPKASPNQTQIDYYAADVVTATDYAPFGMQLFGRTYGASSNKYRYGFNGQEKSTEIDANGNSMTAEFWQYDARLGRRWNEDPIVKEFESPYATLGNNPILMIDPYGNDWYKNRKTDQVEWFDTRKEARAAGLKKHMRVDFYTFTDNPNLHIWHGKSKEELYHVTQEANVIVTAKVSKGYERKRREKYSTEYAVRRRDGLPIQREGDHPDYTNFIGEYKQAYDIKKAFQDGGTASVVFFATPFVIQSAPFILKTYGATFAQELGKNYLSKHGQMGKLDWNDIIVNTVSSKWRLVGKISAKVWNSVMDYNTSNGEVSIFNGKKTGLHVSLDLFFNASKITYGSAKPERSFEQKMAFDTFVDQINAAIKQLTP